MRLITRSFKLGQRGLRREIPPGLLRRPSAAPNMRWHPLWAAFQCPTPTAPAGRRVQNSADRFLNTEMVAYKGTPLPIVAKQRLLGWYKGNPCQETPTNKFPRRGGDWKPVKIQCYLPGSFKGCFGKVPQTSSQGEKEKHRKPLKPAIRNPDFKNSRKFLSPGGMFFKL